LGGFSCLAAQEDLAVLIQILLKKFSYLDKSQIRGDNFIDMYKRILAYFLARQVKRFMFGR